MQKALQVDIPWLKPETPTVDAWIDIIYDIFNLERIAFNIATGQVFEKKGKLDCVSYTIVTIICLCVLLSSFGPECHVNTTQLLF